MMAPTRKSDYTSMLVAYKD